MWARRSSTRRVHGVDNDVLPAKRAGLFAMHIRRGRWAISRTEARRTLGSTHSTSCRGCRYERRLDGARQRAEASGLPAPAAGMSEYRVGTGVDAHAFADGVPLVLGGVRLDHPRGLAGHSDGDVLAHALTDALLGAANLGDIGTLFPSGDERWRGSSSLGLLRTAYGEVRTAGWELVNADCVLIGEE